MKTVFVVYAMALLLASVSYAEDSLDDLKVEHFQVKVKPNSTTPVGRVYSDHSSKIRYNRSRAAQLPYTLEVRGRCPRPTAKLTAFRLRLNNQTLLDIPVSGDNRSLTGNHGKKWEAQTLNVPLSADREALIDACTQLAAQEVQTQSHDVVFNSNMTTSSFDSGQRVQVYYHCEGGAFFDEPVYDKAALPVKALCEATGYQSLLQVTNSQLSLTSITGQSGTCKLNISGEFRTNYELYSLRSNNSTAQLKYRFKYQSGSNNVAYSQWWGKTANPVNGGAFAFNYTDRLPSGIDGGHISLEVASGGEVYTSPSQAFSIDCVDALPLQPTQTLELALAIVADKTETLAVGGQLCPTHAVITGQLDAGYPINGKMLIIGSTLADLYVKPISLSAGQSATQIKRIKLNWASAGTTLSLNGGTPSNALKTQALQYGLRVSNSNNEIVKNLAKKPYTVSCEYPSVNPALPGSTTIGASPNHTGGGAPTSVTGSLPPVQAADKKTVKAGLGSDGELVQLGDTKANRSQQQGRVLTDSDYNEQRSKGASPPPAPITYPTVSTRQKSDKQSKPRAKGKEQQHYTITLENATVSSTRSHQQSNKNRSRPTLFKGRVGRTCQSARFPKNAIVKQAGRQIIVECIKGKVTLNKAKKVKQRWKKGDPVFSPISGNNKKTSQKKQGGILSDEMPEDLPAG